MSDDTFNEMTDEILRLRAYLNAAERERDAYIAENRGLRRDLSIAHARQKACPSCGHVA